ncbi:hypothetical protein ACSQ67_017450 [Phaseolus vulgaris]
MLDGFHLSLHFLRQVKLKDTHIFTGSGGILKFLNVCRHLLKRECMALIFVCCNTTCGDRGWDCDSKYLGQAEGST